MAPPSAMLGASEMANATGSSLSFLRTAISQMREIHSRGGKILVVTRRPDWYQENMPEWYEQMTVSERKGYHLVEGARPTNKR